MIAYPIFICREAQEYCLSKWHCQKLIARADPPGDIRKHLCPFIGRVVEFRQLAVCEITDDHIIIIPFSSKSTLITAIPK